MLVIIAKEERFNSYSHAVGATAAVVMTVVYIAEAINPGGALLIFVAATGFSYVFLFTSSFLYHSRKAVDANSLLWLKLDHSAIFIMMAGSYAGPLYIYAPETLRYSVLAAVAACALIGMALKLRRLESPNWVNVAVYAPLGAISVIPMALLWDRVNIIPREIVHIAVLKGLLVAGLAIYGIAGFVYALKKPDPYPQGLGYHGIFHVLILVGAGLHAIALYYSISAYAAIRQCLSMVSG